MKEKTTYDIEPEPEQASEIDDEEKRNVDYESEESIVSEELSEEDEEKQEIAKIQHTTIKDQVKKIIKTEPKDGVIPGIEESKEDGIIQIIDLDSKEEIKNGPNIIKVNIGKNKQKPLTDFFKKN